jgi:hypothetical protein
MMSLITSNLTLSPLLLIVNKTLIKIFKGIYFITLDEEKKLKRLKQRFKNNWGIIKLKELRLTTHCSRLAPLTIFNHTLLAKLCYNVPCCAGPQAAEFEGVSQRKDTHLALNTDQNKYIALFNLRIDRQIYGTEWKVYAPT